MLEKLVDSIILDNTYHNRFNHELRQRSDKEINDLLKWINETFQKIEECDRASEMILSAMDAQQRWMLANGIIIGLKLGAEIFGEKAI